MWVLSRLFLAILTLSFSYGTIPGDCPTAKYPPKNGGIRPTSYFVHVWISRYDYGEHSCIGVTKKNSVILVPEWCVTIGGEKSGRISIYAPKLTGKVTSYSRACPLERYDQQFDLIYQDDDLRDIIVKPDGSRMFGLPNVVALKIPKEIPGFVSVCTWSEGNFFGKPVTPVVVSWKRGPNGEYFLVQKAIDESKNRKNSFEDLKEGVEDLAEALISIDSRDGTVAFEGFFKDPPKMTNIKRQ